MQKWEYWDIGDFGNNFVSLGMIDIIGASCVIIVIIVAVWHGWKFEVGKEGSGFHIMFFQYPLKRFFKMRKKEDDNS